MIQNKIPFPDLRLLALGGIGFSVGFRAICAKMMKTFLRMKNECDFLSTGDIAYKIYHS